MSSSCIAKTLQAQFLKETGRDFYEWQRLLLSVQHQSQSAALVFIQQHGLPKSRAEFLLMSTVSRMEFLAAAK
jgi:hypothetical protein